MHKALVKRSAEGAELGITIYHIENAASVVDKRRISEFFHLVGDGGLEPLTSSV